MIRNRTELGQAGSAQAYAIAKISNFSKVDLKNSIFAENSIFTISRYRHNLFLITGQRGPRTQITHFCLLFFFLLLKGGWIHGDVQHSIYLPFSICQIPWIMKCEIGFTSRPFLLTIPAFYSNLVIMTSLWLVCIFVGYSISLTA